MKLFHAVIKTVNKPKNAFKTDPDNDEFIINPKVEPPPRPATGKSGNIKKFSPGQEDLLPMNPIFPVSQKFSQNHLQFVTWIFVYHRTRSFALCAISKLE
jgi:hypothetical protein